MQIAEWLENRWVAPAYSAWVLIGLSVCFLAAAINTMVGWLYVLSGLSLALLAIAAIWSARSLSGIAIHRYPIQPVSVGDQLIIELELSNQTTRPKTLLQVQEILPSVLGQTVSAPIEILPPQASYHWINSHPTQRRGIYRWQTVRLRTATPLGLFWCCRCHIVPAKAVVYPTVLPLKHCPVIDLMGQEDRHQFNHHEQRFQAATTGMTRSLRPYRLGDSTRLIHWRTSARYGDFRVRELEAIVDGQEIIIALDNTATWQEAHFEQAVVAAASLYFYASRQQLNVKLWTASSSLVQGESMVLETLAEAEMGQELEKSLPTNQPVIWLGNNPLCLSSLPTGSRWLLWSTTASLQPETSINQDFSGLFIQNEQPLELQLQSAVRGKLMPLR